MTSAANYNGRSLEFFITKKLSERPESSVSRRALESQIRDEKDLSRVSPKLQNSFELASGLICTWVVETGLKTPGALFHIDRHFDSDDGVADITVTQKDHKFSLSVKHNHDALSHPRPYSLAQWLGFPKDSQLDIDHRQRIGSAVDQFRRSTSGTGLFRDVPAQKWWLYKAICAQSVITLRTAVKESGPAKLFDHLVGHGFQKVIVRTDSSQNLSSIDVVDYSTIKEPTAITPSLDVKEKSISLDIAFDNGWKIDMRIHNASSRISASGQLDLKFDARREYGPNLPTTHLWP